MKLRTKTAKRLEEINRILEDKNANGELRRYYLAQKDVIINFKNELRKWALKTKNSAEFGIFILNMVEEIEIVENEFKME